MNLYLVAFNLQDNIVAIVGVIIISILFIVYESRIEKHISKRLKELEYKFSNEMSFILEFSFFDEENNQIGENSTIDVKSMSVPRIGEKFKIANDIYGKESICWKEKEEFEKQLTPKNEVQYNIVKKTKGKILDKLLNNFKSNIFLVTNIESDQRFPNTKKVYLKGQSKRKTSKKNIDKVVIEKTLN